jgi:hypothetical protein
MGSRDNTVHESYHKFPFQSSHPFLLSALHFLCDCINSLGQKSWVCALIARCLPSKRWQAKRLANLEHSLPWLDQPRFLSLRAARANARSSFRAPDPPKPKFMHMHKLLAPVGNPCDVTCRSSGITRSPHNENKQKKKGENMIATDTKKATVATSQTIDGVFHEAMRGYHNFVFQ